MNRHRIASVLAALEAQLEPELRAEMSSVTRSQMRAASGPRLDRRAFLKASASAAGGLLIAAHLPGRAEAAPDKPPPPVDPRLFVRIDPDSRVTLTIQKSEMGQAVRTSLALLLAEELDVDWSKVTVETAPLDPRYPEQWTGGSGSVHSTFESLRQAGAAMRIMLVGAAAARWKVPAAQLQVERGEVFHPASSRRASFGELAADASRRRAPARPPLRPRSQWKLLGKEHAGVDVPDIVHGRARYGLDQRPPGLVFASIERPPEFGATLESVDTAAALAVPGVQKVFPLEPLPRERLPGGVVVVAKNTWAALEGRRRLQIRWKPGPHAGENSDAHRRDMAAALDKAGAEVITRIGDADGELAAARTVVRADYSVPFLAHATMEPMNCTAHWDGQRMTLWSPTQFPVWSGAAVAGALGLKREQVSLHIPLIGGAFGRRINPDYSVEAALVARQLTAPVQVMWTREDDLAHDYYRPCARHRLEACLDERGFPRAMRHRLCDPAIGATYNAPAERIGKEEGEGIVDAYYRIPHRKHEFTLLPSGVPRGWWRSVHDTHTTFAIECFLDELAEAAGADPIEYRLAIVERPPPGTAPDWKSQGDVAFVPERIKDCLKLARDRSGWSQPLPAGRGRGVACCFSHLSYAALVVEASVQAGRAIVHRVVCAVDCGTVVHPSGARAQIEGAITQGISAALCERITIENGRVAETNFDRYRLLRFNEAPAQIEVHFIDRPDVRLTGLGEVGLPAAAPALANALYRATGRRLRDMPLEIPA